MNTTAARSHATRRHSRRQHIFLFLGTHARSQSASSPHHTYRHAGSPTQPFVARHRGRKVVIASGPGRLADPSTVTSRIARPSHPTLRQADTSIALDVGVRVGGHGGGGAGASLTTELFHMPNIHTTTPLLRGGPSPSLGEVSSPVRLHRLDETYGSCAGRIFPEGRWMVLREQCQACAPQPPCTPIVVIQSHHNDNTRPENWDVNHKLMPPLTPTTNALTPLTTR